MIRIRASRLSFFVVLLFSLAARVDAWAADVAYSPKVSLRTGNGILKNVGTVGNGANSIGAINLLFNYFLSGQAAVGLGYSTNHPFSNITLSSRYYYSGQGTRSRAPEQLMVESERRDSFAHYIGAELNQTAYVLTANNGALTDAIPGTSSVVSMTLGSDLRISRHFELTAEANLGLQVITSSNEAIKMKAYILNTGISYVW